MEFLSFLDGLNPWAALGVGFVLLVLGGDSLVRGATSVAKAMGVSPLLIGLTLVGFGTSTPELVTSLQAAQIGSPGIAVGNVVGSNIANILLILGFTALIQPVKADPRAFVRDGWALAIATGAAVAVALYGRLDQIVGVGFVIFLLGYVVVCYFQERGSGPAAAVEAARHVAEVEAVAPARPNLLLSLVLAVGGIAITILGARVLVNGAVAVASGLGVSDTVIGLTVVAVGTSLPELVASVIAAVKRQSEIALGNIVGSNIYNIAGILGITALVAPIPVPPDIVKVDVWVAAAAALVLLVTARSGWRIGRREGLVMLALYAAYVAWLVYASQTGPISI